MHTSNQRAMDASPGFHATELKHFGRSLLVAAGLAAERADTVSDVLLEGDLLGHTTHGFALLPAYLQALQEGSMEKSGEPTVLADHGSALTWDGRYLPGPWLMHRAVAAAEVRLKEHPVVTVAVRRSHHIACLQAYLLPVVNAGHMLLISCSDPAFRTVAPFGATAPCYSPNPIAAGIPTDGDPILVDISTAATSNGVCKRLASAGERLSGEWLLDAAGQPTDDPRVLFNGSGGSVLPLGGVDLGYKGFALGLIIEALTSALAGHGRADQETRWGASVFLQLINPEAFGGRGAFLRETSFLARSCREASVPDGRPPARLPGQAALARRADQLKHGVVLHPTILPALTPWGERLGVSVPKLQEISAEPEA